MFPLMTKRLRHNRLRAILPHIAYYSIQGMARLAEDCGVSASMISLLLNLKRSPSYVLVASVTQAISTRSGKTIPLQEIFSPDGCYPTASTCELMGCNGCRPASAWDERSLTLKPNKLPGDLCPLEESQATGSSSLPKIQC